MQVTSIDRAGVPFDQLRLLIDRLQVVASESTVVNTSGKFSQNYIIELGSHMHRVAHALEEMLVHLQNHNHCSPRVAIPEETLNDVKSFATSSREHALRLSSVVQNVKLAPVLVLLAGMLAPS